MIVFGGRILYPSLRYALLLGSLTLVGCNALPQAPEQGEVQSSSAQDAEQVVVLEKQETPEVVVEELSVATESVVTQVDEVSLSVAEGVNSNVAVTEGALSGTVVLIPASGSQKPATGTVLPREDMAPTNRIDLWLARAELAMGKDQLTTPANNNAYALYARVLMQDENNAAALKGLERIVQRYLTLAKSAHKKGKTQQAQLFLSRANKVVPGHTQIAVVKQQVAQPYVAPSKVASKTNKRKQTEPLQLTKYKPLQTQEQSLLDAPEGMQRQRILLPKGALKKEASALAIYLRSLARQIEEVDGRLYIIAPRDKEVRWVYSLLNGTNPDYRIRANIKHKSPAAIEVMYKADAPLLDVFH